ncbi:MAG: peptidase MA family metallohydrolase [Candidatus Hydrogenedentales bacterium]
MKRLVLAVCLASLTFSAWGAAAQTLQDGLFYVDYPQGEYQTAVVTLENLQRIAAAWRHRLDPGDAPIVVRICATQGDFAANAGFWAPAEVGGVAHSEEGRIVLRTPAQLPNPGLYEGMVRHELIHVLLARNTNLEHLPRWLNEGTAMHISGEHRWNTSFLVARMYLSGRLYTYDDLMLDFSMVRGERPFGDLYAQSLSMTAFLYDRLGEEAFWGLLGSLRDKDFSVALQESAGMTPHEFWAAWYRSLWKVAVISAVMSGFGIFDFMALLVVVGYFRRRRHNRKVLDRWEREEAEEPPMMAAWELEGGSEYPWELDDEEEL